MTLDQSARILRRLRALMARTVANGCTEDEELAAARLVGRLAGQLDAVKGGGPVREQAERVRTERESAEYKAALERNTMEGLLKATIQELALNHINTVSPPGRRVRDEVVQWVPVPDLLMDQLSMMLGIGTSRVARDIVARTIEELIQDGQLPGRLAIPVGRY